MQRPVPNVRVPGAKQFLDAAPAAYYLRDPWYHATDSELDLRMDVGEYRLEVTAVPVLIALGGSTVHAQDPWLRSIAIAVPPQEPAT
jgi:hypothetical protein